MPVVLLLLGPFVAFFGTGFYSGFGAVTAEIYPTAIRATSQGFTYNLGRIASAAAPFTVGKLATTMGSGGVFDCGGRVFAGRHCLVWHPGNAWTGNSVAGEVPYRSYSATNSRRRRTISGVQLKDSSQYPGLSPGQIHAPFVTHAEDACMGMSAVFDTDANAARMSVQ